MPEHELNIPLLRARITHRQYDDALDMIQAACFHHLKDDELDAEFNRLMTDLNSPNKAIPVNLYGAALLGEMADRMKAEA